MEAAKMVWAGIAVGLCAGGTVRPTRACEALGPVVAARTAFEPCLQRCEFLAPGLEEDATVTMRLKQTQGPPGDLVQVTRRRPVGTMDGTAWDSIVADQELETGVWDVLVNGDLAGIVSVVDAAGAPVDAPLLSVRRAAGEKDPPDNVCPYGGIPVPLPPPPPRIQQIGRHHLALSVRSAEAPPKKACGRTCGFFQRKRLRLHRLMACSWSTSTPA